VHASVSGDKDRYTVEIAVRRRCDHALWNLLLPVVLLNFLSFVAFTLDVEAVGERLQITLTLLLTVITFKTSVAGELPVHAYLTVLDKYFIYSIFMSFSNAVEHVVCSAMKRRLLRTKNDASTADPFFTGQLLSFTRFARFLLDDPLFGIESVWVLGHFVCLTAIHAWLWSRWRKQKSIV